MDAADRDRDHGPPAGRVPARLAAAGADVTLVQRHGGRDHDDLLRAHPHRRRHDACGQRAILVGQLALGREEHAHLGRVRVRVRGTLTLG